MSATTVIVMMTCLIVTFDGNCVHALCPLNQLKFAGVSLNLLASGQP
jgi:hypothetical protein